MPLVLRRFLSWIASLAIVVGVVWQWHQPLDYPWSLLLGVCLFVCAFATLAAHKLSIRDTIGYMLPPLLAMIGIGASFLLAETWLQRFALSVLFIGLPFLVLELVYTLTSDPARYPVNALSRLNLALVPLVMFTIAGTLSGISIFLRAPWWFAPIVLVPSSALLAFATTHPTADARHRGRWTALGAFAGLHASAFALILPVGMMVQGSLAALLVAFPLRVRRYGFAPVPSRLHAWSETGIACLLLIGLLVSARWA